MARVRHVDLVFVDESDEGCGALVGGLRVAGVEGNLHQLLPLALYLIKGLVQRLHDLLLRFCALQVLLEVPVQVFAAVVCQLPAIAPVEDCGTVAGEAAPELPAAQAIVVRLIGRPLQGLNAMPDLVSQDGRLKSSGFFFFIDGGGLALSAGSSNHRLPVATIISTPSG